MASCHHINHQPSKQRTLLVIGTNQGCTSPDKATRDAAFETMKGWMADPAKADPRMDPTANPMPFDGKRMIFGGFRPVVELGVR